MWGDPPVDRQGSDMNYTVIIQYKAVVPWELTWSFPFYLIDNRILLYKSLKYQCQINAKNSYKLQALCGYPKLSSYVIKVST